MRKVSANQKLLYSRVDWVVFICIVVLCKSSILGVPMLLKNLSKRKRLDKEQKQSFWNESLAQIELEPLDLSFLKLNAQVLAQDSKRSFGSKEHGADTLSELNFSFDKKIWSDLNRLKKQHTINSYIYGQSIFAILLNKYTGQDGFCIKHSIATKIRKRFYCTYVDTCVIPYNFKVMHNVIDVIRGSQEIFKLYREIKSDHLLMIEKSLPPNNDLANVAFIQIGAADTASNFDNVKADIQRYTDITCLGDLVFAQELRKETVNYRVSYRPNKIDTSLLKNFVECYKKLFIEVLEELLRNETLGTLTAIRNYTILPIDQYQQVVQAWNNTDEVYVEGAPINLLFEEQVRKTPEKVAVIYQDTRIQYRELNEKVNRLTSYLKKCYAINPDTLVAVCLERNEHMIVGILAVLKAGGAYVPLDPNYPDDRIAYILNDTNTKLILTNEINKKRIEQIINICPPGLTENSVNSRSEVLALDNIDFQEQLLLEPGTNPNVSITSNNLAYIIYTSGTTGKPKGVMIEHRSVVNLRNDLSKRYKLGENDNNEVILQFANYAFDASVEQIVLSLLNGYSLLLLPKHLWLDKDNFYQYLSDHKVTHIHAVPSVLEQYNFRNIKTLKRLIFGGENLTRTCYSKTERSSEVVVINEYGPTETTITSIVNVVKNEDLSIGVPIFNTKAYVLSRDLIPLPIGAVGELYIGGIGLARGYLNKPELTAERFIPNPFQTQGERTSEENFRLYKTGDLVRWLPNGHLEYIGRNDFQVKIRGYRIELGEIESVLSSYEGINKSVVLAKERLSKDGMPTGNKYLIGYYVSPLPSEEAGVLQYLQARLPEYMVPHILVHLPSLPLTNSGKLDIKALPESSLHLEDGYIAPQNEIEGRLCNLWASVLELNESAVGIRDDFFRLGGDSILAIRLVGKINSEFKSQLKARDILESRCISKLIDIISKAKDVAEEKESYVPFSLVKVEDYKSVMSNINLIEDIYPASSLQGEMLSESASGNRDAYHNISSYLVHAKFNKDKLLSIVNQLINKHELLRACFVPDKDRGWSIIIYKSVPICYQIYTNKNGRELIANERANTFDYARPGLFRIVINDLEDKFNLIFSFHHVIEDG